MKGFWTIAIVKWILILTIAVGCSWISTVSAIDVQNSIQNKKGLALTGSKIEDVKKLGASWFYVYSVWGEHLETVGYVPMLYDGTPDANLPNDYDGYVLIFNESTISPEEGAQRYLMLLDLYEDAMFVVGGAVEADPTWAIGFLEQLQDDEKPDYWHVHHYFGNDVKDAIRDLKNFYHIVRKPLWVTEFGSTTANKEATSAFMLFMEKTSWIAHYAYFPTRIPEVSGGNPTWFPSHWSIDMALVDWDTGELTEMGLMYRDFEVHNVHFPKVEK